MKESENKRQWNDRERERKKEKKGGRERANREEEERKENKERGTKNEKEKKYFVLFFPISVLSFVEYIFTVFAV